MAKARSNRWWKSLTHEEQVSYLEAHPSSKFKLTKKVSTPVTEVKDSSSNVLGEGVIKELPSIKDVELHELPEEKLDELEKDLAGKVDEILPEPKALDELISDEDKEVIESELETYVRTRNKKDLVKPISKMVLKLGIIGVSLVVTGSITPMYLFLPSVYQDILSSSDEWADKGSDLLSNSVNFIRKTLKSKNKGKFLKDSVFKPKALEEDEE